MKKDMVNHPSHYNLPGRKECFDEMLEFFGVEAFKHFCLLNVYKYMYRAEAKNGEEDWKKADNYADKFLEMGGSPQLLTETMVRARGGDADE